MINHAHLLRCKLPIVTHKAGERWYRIHDRSFDPIFFGPLPGSPPRSRFDDPRGEYRVCYLGLSHFAVVAETLLHSPSRRILHLDDLRKRSFATVWLERDVNLVELHGPGLNMLDITSDVVDGAFTICGELARVLYDRPEVVDGVEYRSRHDNGEIAIALFDRASDAISLESTIPMDRDFPLLTRIIDRYQIDLS